MIMNMYVVNLDGKGNIIKTKKESLKVIRNGEYTSYPVEKNKYDRSKVKKELEEEER